MRTPSCPWINQKTGSGELQVTHQKRLISCRAPYICRQVLHVLLCLCLFMRADASWDCSSDPRRDIGLEPGLIIAVFSIQALWNLRSPSTIKCWIFPLVSNKKNKKNEHPGGWLNTRRHTRPDPPLCLRLLLDSLSWRNPIYWAGRDSRGTTEKEGTHVQCWITHVIETEVQVELKSFFLEKKSWRKKDGILRL